MARSVQLVTFYLGEAMYGVDIRLVKEVNPSTEIYPVPRSERHVRGLLNIRGQVVLVMDVAVVFGAARRQIQPQSQVVIFKVERELTSIPDLDDSIRPNRYGDKPLGFLVDRIGDVITIDSNRIEPPPKHLSETNSRYFSGVIRMEDEILLILNPEAIV